MKKIKLLTPILGLSALACTTIPLASCSNKPTETKDHVDYKGEKEIEFNGRCILSFEFDGSCSLDNIDVKLIGDNLETLDYTFTVSGNKLLLSITSNSTSVYNYYEFDVEISSINTNWTKKFEGFSLYYRNVPEGKVCVNLTVTSGKAQKQTLMVDKGSTWAQVKELITILPDSGFKFANKWFDLDDNPIQDTYVVNGDMVVKAVCDEIIVGWVEANFDDYIAYTGDSITKDNIIVYGLVDGQTIQIPSKDFSWDLPSDSYTFTTDDQTTGYKTINLRVYDKVDISLEVPVSPAIPMGQIEQTYTVVKDEENNPIGYSISWPTDPDFTDMDRFVIPASHYDEEYGTLPVIEIAERGYSKGGDSNSYCVRAKEIYIPWTVRKIGNKAFRCIADWASQTIQKIVFGKGSQLTEIGDGAFFLEEAGCTLNSMNIPLSLNKLGNNAMDGNDLFITYEDGCIYLKGGDDLNQYTFVTKCNSQGQTQYSINENTKSILSLQYAGYSASGDVTINLPGVQKLCDNSLQNTGSSTHGLTINLSNDLKYIGNEAFKQSYLASLTIPANVEFIGKDIFNGCNSLSAVTLTSKEGWSVVKADGSEEPIEIDPSALSTPEATCELFKTTYKDYYWIHSVE